MSFDATNPEHHDQFTRLVYKAFEKEWLNNANQQNMAKEGRPLTLKQKSDILEQAEKQFGEWLAQIWDEGRKNESDYVDALEDWDRLNRIAGTPVSGWPKQPLNPYKDNS